MSERPGMTRAERQELGQLIRKRERVMKAGAEDRAAAMMAEFEAQCGAIYSCDDDAVWKQAMMAAEEVVNAAKATVADRCRDLGIPPEFAPGIHLFWSGRGQNALNERRGELRRMAKTRIEAIKREAVTKIERLSLEAQTEVVAHGLESEAARGFLERMPALDTLMPALDAHEIKAVVDQRAKRREP